MNIIKKSLDKLQDDIDSPIDVFICSASFEERSKKIPESLDHTKVRSAIVCRNIDLLDVVEGNFNLIVNHFGAAAMPVDLDTSSPIVTADNLLRAVKAEIERGAKRFLIDITTFTHEAMLILMKIVSLLISQKSDVEFCYSIADSYPGAAINGEGWLSKGIGEIRSVLGYPGFYQPERRIHLVVLVGMERERVEKLIDAYEPNIVSLGKGLRKSTINETMHDYNDFYFKKIKSKYQYLHDFTFSCSDPISAKKSILDQVKRFSDHNIVLAPLNNKVSTAGAALAAIENTDIQICYAHANEYNVDNYSSPSDFYIKFKLPDLWL